MKKQKFSNKTLLKIKNLCFEGLSIDKYRRVVIHGETEIELTYTEFEILLLLLQNKGRVFSREDILNRIWSGRSICAGPHHRREHHTPAQEIGVYGKCIVTRLGYGYCFEAE